MTEGRFMPDLNQRGAWRRLSPARKFINDLVYFARKVPSIPVACTMNVGAVDKDRRAVDPRPSWTAVFIKAYALLAQRHPQLRQSFIRWPWTHLYEHPFSVCGVAIERESNGERILLGTQIRGPEHQSLIAIDQHLRRYKEIPIEEIGYFRMALRIGRLPQSLRRLLWWSTLHMSGQKRAKRLGTFMLSSYGSLGAEQMHPIGPLTTLLTFGPIGSSGEVVVKIIYDHRVLDGAEVARCLRELEQTLSEDIRAELRETRSLANRVHYEPPHGSPLAGPHANEVASRREREARPHTDS